MKLDINKISLPQMFNDSQGKTSPSLVIGVCGCLVALGGILVSGNVIAYLSIWSDKQNTEVINFMSSMVVQCIGLFGLAGAMITSHRLSSDKPVAPGVVSPPKQPQDI